MIEERLLRTLIKKIIEEQNIKLRTHKGYGGSHPVVNRKPLIGFGKMYQFEEEPKKKPKNKKQKVKVSKAFEENDFDDLDAYSNIIKEILNGRTIHK